MGFESQGYEFSSKGGHVFFHEISKGDEGEKMMLMREKRMMMTRGRRKRRRKLHPPLPKKR